MNREQRRTLRKTTKVERAEDIPPGTTAVIVSYQDGEPVRMTKVTKNAAGDITRVQVKDLTDPSTHHDLTTTPPQSNT